MQYQWCNRLDPRLQEKTKKMEFPDLTCPLKTWLSGKRCLKHNKSI